ncbi:hypothetical protein GF352_03985 [archaeon]|nr:hypothetical protein [archaeon]
MLVRLVLRMPEYCAECGYPCCDRADCYLGSECREQGHHNHLCDTYPFYSMLHGYTGPYGALGVDCWRITNHCDGLDLMINNKRLGDILQGFKDEISTGKELLRLEDNGVELIVNPVKIEEVKCFQETILKYLIKTSCK